MATTVIQEHNNACSFWSGVSSSTTDHPSLLSNATQELLQLALAKMEKATVLDLYGNEHDASYYAFMLYVVGDEIAMKIGCNPNEQTNAMIQSAVLLALQESCYKESLLSYGSELLFDLKKAGIKLARNQVAALLAQEGSWISNRSKGDLMAGNIAAVCSYCANLVVKGYWLLEKKANFGGTEQDLTAVEAPTELTTPEEVIRFYLNEYALPYLQNAGSKEPQKQVDAFLRYLAQSDFYAAPCSTKYHLSVDGGLAQHTINVLMMLIKLALPATREQLGACVLAAIGHDLCKVGVYKKNTKSKKIYLTEGQPAPEGAFIKSDNGGQFYWGETAYYEFSDSMPFGHGRKSAYMMQGFFPEISQDVYTAIDGHMADPGSNPDYMKLYASNPLAIYLHIADVIAANIVEV